MDDLPTCVPAPHAIPVRATVRGHDCDVVVLRWRVNARTCRGGPTWAGTSGWLQAADVERSRGVGPCRRWSVAARTGSDAA